MEEDGIMSTNASRDDSLEKTRSCAVCQAVANLKRCSRCKSTFYCCREHQKTDWLSHKNICSLTVNLNPTSSTQSTGILSQTTCESNDETKSEIESILDFRHLNHEPKSDIEDQSVSKDIFVDLKDSNEFDYAGPSDDMHLNEFPCAPHSSSEVDLNEFPCAPHSSSEVQDLNDENERESTDASYHQAANSECCSNSQEAVNSVDSVEELPTPFDMRPRRKLIFPKPTSYEHKDLAEFIGLRLINLGYCILDELFRDEDIDKMSEEFLDLKRKNENNCEPPVAADNDSTGNKRPSNEVNSNSESEGIRWFEANEEYLPFTAKALHIVDSIMNMIDPHIRRYGKIQGRTKAVIAHCAGNGSSCRRRIDNTSKDGRRVTCVLFIANEWEIERDGGLVRILPPHLDKPVDVPPKRNRLLFFWSHKRNPYEIHPIHQEMFFLKVWYFDREEKEEAKVKELLSQTEEINARISELEEKKREIEESTRQQQIQNHAMAAVRSLSDEELQAMSVLIHNHPQPKQVMTAIGIAPSIQDALIIYLGNLQLT